MAARVAGHVEDARDLAAQRVAVALAHRHVDAGNAVAVGARADDGAAGRRLQLVIAAGVVVVVVGVEDMGEAPALLGQRREHRRRHRRIDRGGDIGLGLVQKIDVVVSQHRDLADDELGHGRLPSLGFGLI